jgi:3-oxoacyl-[acyl-carrier protein] reductase
MADLSGRVALVTGAGRGIGKTVAQVLAGHGMVVAINDYDPVTAQATADELVAAGQRAIAIPCDVSNKAQVQAMVARVEEELGPIWLLINNAGVYNAAPTVEMSEEAWDKAFDVDAKGVFLVSQAAIQHMIPRQAGRIVNFSSIAGHIVRTAQIAYCSAKAAVIHFSRCLAVEMAPYGITVNCLCPGMTWTQMLSVTAIERGLDLDSMIALIPAGHMAQEVDHAHLVAYFATDEAAHVTGQVVSVDGAQSLYHPLAAVRMPAKP